MAVADLIYTIAGDSSRFVSALRQADQQLERTTRNMSGMAKAGAILGAGLGVVAGYLTDMTKQALDDADALAKLSYRTGATVEELSRLEYALDLSDGSLEDFGVGAKNLNKILVETENGNARAAKALSALGVSALDVNGKARGLNDVFMDVADRFKEMPDGSRKSAAAVDIFGKAGLKLIPTLNSGSDGLKAMGDEAEQLGLVMSTETADAAQAVNDNITRVEKAGVGLGRQIVTMIGPALAGLTNEMLENAKKADNMREKQNSAFEVMRGSLIVVSSLSVAVKILTVAIGGLAATIALEFELATESLSSFLSSMSRIPTAARVIHPALGILGSLGDMRLDIDPKTRGQAATGTERSKALREQIAKDLTAVSSEYLQTLDRLKNMKFEVPAPTVPPAAATEEGRNFGVNFRKGAKDELEKIAEDMKRAADRIFADTRNTAEQAQAQFAELTALVMAGYVDEETANRRARQIEAERDKEALEFMDEYQEKAREIRASVLTDAEQLKQKIMELQGFLGSELISKETYGRAIEALGADVTKSALKPVEQLRAEHEKLKTLLDVGAISAQTYGRATRALAGDVVIGDTERLQAELDKINELLRLGIISADEYQKALANLFPSKTVDDTKTKLTEMQQFSVDAAKSLQSSFADFLFDPLNTSFGDMVKSFANALRRMVAELLAKQAVLGLLKMFGASPQVIGAFTGEGFAEGGYVAGPGTATSDSIPARLSNGEYVMPADTVRHFGRDFMDGIRAMRPQREAPVARFAEGGYVQGGQGTGAGVRVVNVVDSSMVQDFLTSSAGEQVILNTIRRNRRQVSQVMA